MDALTAFDAWQEEKKEKKKFDFQLNGSLVLMDSLYTEYLDRKRLYSLNKYRHIRPLAIDCGGGKKKEEIRHFGRQKRKIDVGWHSLSPPLFSHFAS